MIVAALAFTPASGLTPPDCSSVIESVHLGPSLSFQIEQLPVRHSRGLQSQFGRPAKVDIRPRGPIRRPHQESERSRPLRFSQPLLRCWTRWTPPLAEVAKSVRSVLELKIQMSIDRSTELVHPPNPNARSFLWSRLQHIPMKVNNVKQSLTVKRL